MAELMNAQLDQLESAMIARQGTREGRMRKRVAFVFVSSPNSVTPVHFDIEHSLLMMVSGKKTVSIGRFESDAVRRHEVDRYWDGSHGRIENLPPEVATFTMTPGRGVYIPPGTPHWVHNGPDISLSVTLTYFTAATVRENRIEDFNSHLRRRHMKPQEPGHSRHRRYGQGLRHGRPDDRTTPSVRRARREAGRGRYGLLPERTTGRQGG